MQIFLVLSAFLMTGSILRKGSKNISLKEKIGNRFHRIYPSFLLVVLFCALAGFLMSGYLGKDFIPLLFASQNFYHIVHGTDHTVPMTAHLWYINLDIYLFLIWLLILYFVNPRHYTKYFIICIAIAIAWRVCCVLSGVNLYTSYTVPIGQLDSFAIGGLLAVYIHNSKLEKSKNRLSVVLMSIGLVGVMFIIGLIAYLNDVTFIKAYYLLGTAKGYAGHPVTVNIFSFYAVLGAGLILWCLGHRKLPGRIAAVLVFLGGISYELYLFHLPALILMIFLLGDGFAAIILAFLLTVIAAAVYSRTLKLKIERITKPIKKEKNVPFEGTN